MPPQPNTACPAQVIEFATVMPGRSMVHADSTYFIALALGYRSDVAYWIAAYNEVTDYAQYVPIDQCGNAGLEQDHGQTTRAEHGPQLHHRVLQRIPADECEHRRAARSLHGLVFAERRGHRRPRRGRRAGALSAALSDARLSGTYRRYVPEDARQSARLGDAADGRSRRALHGRPHRSERHEMHQHGDDHRHRADGAAAERPGQRESGQAPVQISVAAGPKVLEYRRNDRDDVSTRN